MNQPLYPVLFSMPPFQWKSSPGEIPPFPPTEACAAMRSVWSVKGLGGDTSIFFSTILAAHPRLVTPLVLSFSHITRRDHQDSFF
jgi:hypothetical protein